MDANRSIVTPAELAGVLEMLAQALRMLPAGGLQLPVVPAAAPAPAASLLVADWMGEYRQIIGARGLNPQTIKNRTAAQKHIVRLWGSRPLAELRPQEVAAKIKTLSTSNAGRVLSELRDVYVEAIAADKCDNSPAALIKPPKHNVMRERLEFSVWQQMREWSRNCNQRWVESMLLLAIVIGQRRADLAKVRFDDVVDGHLRVEQQKKAGKKLGARVEIPLTLRLDCIEMTVGEVIEHCRSTAAPGPTLLRKANGKPIEMSSLSARFCEAIKAVLGKDDPGTHHRPSLHEARSLSARCYVEQGLAPATVQVLLGHSAVEMTKLYLNERDLATKKWKRVPLKSEIAAQEP